MNLSFLSLGLLLAQRAGRGCFRDAKERRTNKEQIHPRCASALSSWKGRGLYRPQVFAVDVWAVFSGSRLAVKMSALATYEIWKQKTLLTVSGGQGWENRWVLFFSLRCSSPHRNRAERISDDHSGGSRAWRRSTFRYNPSTGRVPFRNVEFGGASSLKLLTDYGRFYLLATKK